MLILLRQDWWWWSDTRLVFGFLPIGLLSQIVVSLLSAGVWWLATRIAWPVPAATPPVGTRSDRAPPDAPLPALSQRPPGDESSSTATSGS